MRRSLSLLLMVVLVLRGLAGTAMAAGVLPPSTHHGSPHSSHSAAGMPATQTHHHAGAHAEAGAAHPQGAHGGAQFEALAGVAAEAACDGTADCADHTCTDGGHHAATCSACEICHSAMLDVPSVDVPGHRPAGSLRMVAAAPFDSAPPARAIKPPIA